MVAAHEMTFNCPKTWVRTSPFWRLRAKSWESHSTGAMAPRPSMAHKQSEPIMSLKCFQKVIIEFNGNFCNSVAEFHIMSHQCLQRHIVFVHWIELISLQKFQKLKPRTKDFDTCPENCWPPKNMLVTKSHFVVYVIEPLQQCSSV